MNAICLFATFVAAVALAWPAPPQRDARSNAPDAILLVADFPQGQGCCSWHGGECGCSNGRDVCCDGSLSPSCTCHSDQLKPADEMHPILSDELIGTVGKTD
jgi:hypothetical protein